MLGNKLLESVNGSKYNSMGLPYTTEVISKNDRYEAGYNSLVKILGENGDKFLNEAFAKANADDMQSKFEVMCNIAQTISKNLKKNTDNALQGKSYEQLQELYNNSYTQAFGIKNDMMQRIMDYSASQEIGAGIVKAGTTIAASIASSFIPGIGIIGVAAITAGTTIANEVTDRATSGKALNTLKEEGLSAYLSTTNDDIDWEATFKQAAVSGIMMVGFGAVSRGVQILTVDLAPAVQGATMFGANMAFGAGAEYVMTGEVSVQGVVLTGVFSLVAGVLQFHAANVTKAAEDAIKSQLQQDISNARSVLGIDDSVEVTSEMLKGLKRNLAKQYHPDVAQSSGNHSMADINAAIDLLQKNLSGARVDINACVATTRAAASSADKTAIALANQSVNSGLQKKYNIVCRSCWRR